MPAANTVITTATQTKVGPKVSKQKRTKKGDKSTGNRAPPNLSAPTGPAFAHQY